MERYDHQQKIKDEDPLKKGVFTGTGSGKTRICLDLAEGRTLVICPKTQRDDKTWEREAEKMGLNPNGSSFNLTVLSKEEFRRDWVDLEGFDTVIGDEAHTLLGVTPNIKWVKRQPQPKTSQVFEAMRLYLFKHPPKRLYLATATIVKNPFTVWGAGVLLGAFNYSTHAEFREIFYVKLPMGGRREVYSPKSTAENKKRLARLVKKLGYVGQLSDYFDVPPQTFKDEYVELTYPQKQSIKDIVLEYPDPLVQIGKRNQIENGVLKGNEYSADQQIKDNKTDRIVEYSHEFHQMIVFVKYTQQIYKLEHALKKANKKVYIMNGQTPDRGAQLKELRKKDEYVFIVQSQISAGWELPDCPVMIFASRTHSFVDYEQGLGRILRANKLKKNLYINLMTRYPHKQGKKKKGSIDEAINDCLKNKKSFDKELYIRDNE